jgi:sugar phosphate isomerase/epimerase
MRLSVVVAKEDAPESAFVVWRGFERSIEKASALGFQGVELALESADDVEPQKLDNWLSKNDVAVSCISTGLVYATRGLSLSHSDPAIRKEALATFRSLISLAGDYGGFINIGRARGFLEPGKSRETTELLFVEALIELCDAAEPLGVEILVEPVNRYETNFLNSLDEAAAVLARADRNNAGLMPDLFHMNIEEASLTEALIRHKDRVRYVHLADSNRQAPGQGHTDFDGVLAGLRQMRFDGWTAIEILPVPDPDTAARLAADFILPRLRDR